jgi:site-specific recombinase XerD
MTCFNPPPERLRRYRIGPLEPHIEGFAALLSQQGYCLPTGMQKIVLVADLSWWLERKRIKLNQLGERYTDAFLQARWRRSSFRYGDRVTMRALLQHLRRHHAIPTPAPAPPSVIDLLKQEYASFLIQERALMQSSINNRLRITRRFLSYCFRDGKVRLKSLRAKDITDFVLQDTSGRGRGDAQSATTALRSFLGFLFQRGRITNNLALAVPKMAGWPLSQLPRFLEAKQVENVLRTCDRRTTLGKRNYAILLLLARLGLRAGEVVKLSLEDIDWGAGELLIHGKGARADKLPLLQDVGQALAAYLRKARPACSSRRVFIRGCAPYRGFAGPCLVANIAQKAMDCAQIQSPHRGAHVLRHSLATSLLGHGASLAQIGQVLRHRSVRSTEIYAKVDLSTLRRLALPWPGGAL